MKNEKLSASLEDYLETIYIITQDKHKAHANEIAEQLAVGKSSVSWALNQLSKKELINYTPYEAITLTEQGKAVASRVAGHHINIKNFLTEVLAVNEKVAELNACRMEHVMDKEILQRMWQFMDFLNKCPRLGREWVLGFGQFCKEGDIHENSPQCFNELPEQINTDAHIQKTDSTDTHALPKISKDRDYILLGRLQEVLRESGHNLSREAITVAEIFLGCERHQTIPEIFQQARKIKPKINKKIVESVMRILCEHKIARELSFGGQTVFEHFHPESHHDHIFCVKCGSIFEFFDPRIELLQSENARRANFRLLRHNLDIYGVCNDCIKQESQTRNLVDCLTGETVEIVRIIADKTAQTKIMEMGIVPGIVAYVLSENCGGGNIIVMVGTTRLTLDRASAEKIRIVPVHHNQTTFGRRRRVRHRHRAEKIFSFSKKR